MTTNEKKVPGVKSINTSFDIIDQIAQSNEKNLTDIADELDLAPSTVHGHLETLKARGLVVSDSDGYKISLKFLEYGMEAKDQKPLAKIAEPVLQELADETGEFVTLLVEERGYGVILDRAAGKRAIEPIGKIGRHFYLHCIASGKAILAELSDRQIEEIIDQHGLPEQTPHTITDVSMLWEEIEEIRAQNLAYEEEEIAQGIRAVGVPIIPEDKVRGAIDVSGPANRMKDQKLREEVPDLLLGAANELELRLTHESPK